MNSPTLIVDTREQDRLPLQGPWELGTLYSGDYSLKGAEDYFAVERKTLSDLVGSLTSGRERFENELRRLRGCHFARLLIVGDEADLAGGRYRSKMNPVAAVNSLAAFEVRYVPVVWVATPALGAALVRRWATWFAREFITLGANLVKGISQPSPDPTVPRRKEEEAAIERGYGRSYRGD